MSFQNSLCSKAEKFKAFFEDKSPGQILVLISPYTFPIDYAGHGFEERPLSFWDFERDIDSFMEDRIAKLRFFSEYTKDLDNDYIPSISGGLGIGVDSAYLSGAEVIFGEETSWVHPVINDWEDMKNLRMDESNQWFQLLKHMTKVSVEMCDGDYFTGTFPHLSPTDMANALRGNQIFYDYYDYPEKVHELMQISSEAILWLERELRKITQPIMGGTVTANMWFPGEAPFFSEDVADLCSPDIYKEFGFKHTQNVIDAIGGAYIHHHAKGLHVHKEIAKLSGLKTLEISWDPNCPRPIDRMAEVYGDSNGVPLMTRCTAADVYDRIEEMKKGRLILMLNIKSLEEGREVMKFIRKHSRI